MGNCCQTIYAASTVVDQETIQIDDFETKSVICSDTKTSIAHALWMKEYDESKIDLAILAQIHSSKNSPNRFASRRAVQMQNYLNNPVFLNPDYTERYTTLLKYTYGKELSPHQISTMSVFLGLDSVTGYKPIPVPSGITFPKYDEPQWENPVGWHFFVGNCVAENGHEYGVEMMFWREALLPPDMALIAGLRDIENQTVSLHLAISDKSAGIHYRAEPTIIAGTTGLIGFTTSPTFNYTMGKTSLKSTSELQTFPLRLQAKGFGQVQIGTGKEKSEDIEIEIDLTLEQKKDYFLQGDGGCSPSVDGIGTLYYSISNLQLEGGATNMLVINRDKIPLKSGKLWYDHQWGTGFMPPGNAKHAVTRAFINDDVYVNGKKPGGWDWFMVQFDSNVELALSALHSAKNEKFYGQTGEKPPGIMTVLKIEGKYIDKSSTARNITGTLEVTEWYKSTVSPNPKIYWPTNTWYPNLFHVSIECDSDPSSLPEECRQFSLVPIVNGQTGFFANGLQYSEGGVTVHNEENQKIGMGFAESTGYAKNINNILAITGLPETQEIIDILDPKMPVSKELFLESGVYLLLPGNGTKLEEILKEARPPIPFPPSK